MKTFEELRTRNLRRCAHPHGFNHPLDSWSLSDWHLATSGELGEAANVMKKINRHRDGIREPIPLLTLYAKLADELADTMIYLDLLAARAGINLAEAVECKFNSTSADIGYIEAAPLPRQVFEGALYANQQDPYEPTAVGVVVDGEPVDLAAACMDYFGISDLGPTEAKPGFRVIIERTEAST